MPAFLLPSPSLLCKVIIAKLLVALCHGELGYLSGYF